MLTPTATITATLTMRPALRVLTYVASIHRYGQSPSIGRFRKAPTRPSNSPHSRLTWLLETPAGRPDQLAPTALRPRGFRIELRLSGGVAGMIVLQRVQGRHGNQRRCACEQVRIKGLLRRRCLSPSLGLMNKRRVCGGSLTPLRKSGRISSGKTSEGV